MLFDAVPNVGRMYDVACIDARFAWYRAGIDSRDVGVDPRPRAGIQGQVFGQRNPDVTGPGRKPYVAHYGRSGRPIRFGSRKIASDRIPRDRKTGEFLDAVRNLAQPRKHRPLAKQKPRQFAGRHRRSVRKLEPDHRTFEAGHWIDDRGALLRFVRVWIPYPNTAVEVAGELMQYFDNHHATLAVADQDRPHAFRFVVPGELSCQLLAVAEAAIAKRPIPGVADTLLGVAHGDQELGEILHRHHRETALQGNDSGCGCAREQLFDVSFRYMFCGKREDAVF